MENRIQKYIQEALKQALSQKNGTIPTLSNLGSLGALGSLLNLGNLGESEFQPEVFETHKFVIARVELPERFHAQQIRVFAGSNRLTLDGLPEDSKTVVKLPSSVANKGSKAVLKDGILEVVMLKESGDRKQQEIDIQFL